MLVFTNVQERAELHLCVLLKICNQIIKTIFWVERMCPFDYTEDSTEDEIRTIYFLCR